MKIIVAIGNDHAGTLLKFQIKQFLEEFGYRIKNYGTDTEIPVDYPDSVHPIAKSIKNKEAEFGILLCGSAQGVSISANKYTGIRAAVCWNTEIAALSRKHNNANILCLPARFLSEKLVKEISAVFIQTEFEGGRHLNRVNKIGMKAY
jgi:ribose 5-phosphate isomerase B